MGTLKQYDDQGASVNKYMLLAGDVGGTKTASAILSDEANHLRT